MNFGKKWKKRVLTRIFEKIMINFKHTPLFHLYFQDRERNNERFLLLIDKLLIIPYREIKKSDDHVSGILKKNREKNGNSLGFSKKTLFFIKIQF